MFPQFAKTLNFFRSAHSENIKVDVTCYTPFLDCLQMWRGIASTMSGSWDKIRFISPMSAKLNRHSKKTTLQTARLNIMIIIRIYRTWVISMVWRWLCFWSWYWERKLLCICYTRLVIVYFIVRVHRSRYRWTIHKSSTICQWAPIFVFAVTFFPSSFTAKYVWTNIENQNWIKIFHSIFWVFSLAAFVDWTGN